MAAFRNLVVVGVSLAAGLIVSGLLTPLTFTASGAEEKQPPAFQWNVFLNDWHVIGPFPRPTRNKGCLGVDFLGGEPKVTLDETVTWKGKKYRWKAFPEAVVNMQKALKVQSDEADYHAAYAWTRFTSPKNQKAILALAHDDGARVWFNGKEVHRYNSGTAAYLDQATDEVDLQEGANTLLMKVEQLWGDWAALARLRPAGLDKPLVSIGCDYLPSTGTLNVPTLELDLLDADGKRLQTLKTGGYRVKDPKRILFTCYAPTPDPTPAKVRIRYRHPMLADYDRTIDWPRAQDEKFSITVKAAAPLTGRVVDAETGKPIADARFKIDKKTCAERSAKDGRFSLAEFNPVEATLVVAAAGYQPRIVPVGIPESGDLVIKLNPGAQVLLGTVVDEDDRPIEGAKVRPGLCRGWITETLTDKEGRFEIIGIPADREKLYPTIAHPDYVPKDSFGQPMDSDKVTEVRWTLQTGAVVTGCVTGQADGKPLKGIQVVSGFSRFASNRVNPEAKTDADGQFRLSGVNPGEAMIHAFSDRFAPRMARVFAKVGEPVEVDFQLEVGKPVTGRVTDPRDKPIPGVWIITDTWEGMRVFRREAHTDAEGRFTLAHMPSTPVEMDILKKGYVSKRNQVVVGGEHHELTLKPVVKHTVRLRLADTKKPPAKVEIHAGYLFPGRDQVHWDRRSYLDRNYNTETGVYEITMDEPTTAKRYLRFRVPGYRDAEVEIPEEAGEAQAFDFVLETLSTIQGRVVSARNGEPLEGIMVALVNQQDRIRMDHYTEFGAGYQLLDEFTGMHAITSPDGSFELPKPEAVSDYDVLLIKKGKGFHYLPNALSLFGQKTPELPYPRHGTVEGAVLIAGKPSPNESVRIGWIPNPGTARQWDHPFGCGGIVRADAEGRFRFEGLGPGRYQISRVREFRTPGMGGMSCYLTSEELALLPGETVTHDLIQPAGHTVTGQTVDPDGKPLSGCIVSVMQRDPKPTRLDVVQSDSHGHFTIAHLPKGSLEFSADHYSRKSGRTCGLGDQDFRGKITVDVEKATKVTIPMKPFTQGRPTAATSLTGTLPPDFRANILGSDKPFVLSEQWGKVVALDFWATWCGPCMAVMPAMKKIHEEYKNRDDVVFVTVSLDQSEESLRKIIKEKELAFPVIFSGKGFEDPAAAAFGVRGIPSSFVIGRDGRFATERVHGSQLASAIKTALKKPLDPAFADGKKPARLTVKVELDEEGTGLPGANLHLRAVNPEGKDVREEKLPMPGQAARIVWLYPPLDQKGSKVVITVRAEGMREQTRNLPDPGPEAELAFRFTSPRQIVGRITADDGKTPAPEMKLTARRDDGFRRSAISDKEGRFRIPALPGSYQVFAEGNDQFQPVARNRVSTNVPDTRDPEPLELEACHTIVLKGLVQDEEGKPVSGAEVFWRSRLGPAETDDQGRFSLAGVPSRGEIKVYARKEDKIGQITLENADPKQDLEIQLGQMSESRDGLVPGKEAPVLVARSLEDGSTVDWKPAKDKKTLVIFSALWHPQGRELLRQAKAWANDHGAHLAAFSIDWCPEQARRHLASLDLDTPMLFAGPGGLAASADWHFASPGQVFLVSPKRKILSVPGPLKVP